MFEVRTKSPFDDDWEERDEQIYIAAAVDGKFTSHYSGAGFGGRDHGWYVSTFEEAMDMKKRLNAVQGVVATVREAITP